MIEKADSYMLFVVSLKFPCTVGSDTPDRKHPSVSVSDNHFPVVSYVPTFFALYVKTRGIKPLAILTSSFGQFLYYRPVRTVTGLIARSVFILPSCRNRHRTHHDEEELLFL